jgi:hypothetical protein
MSWFPAEKGASVAAALSLRMIWPLFDYFLYRRSPRLARESLSRPSCEYSCTHIPHRKMSET